MNAWLFNNLALTMRSQAYLYTKAEGFLNPVSITSSCGATATRRVRSRVSIGDKQTTAILGNEPLTLKPGGTFELKKGRIDVVLTRVVLGGAVGSTFDTLVLTKKADFTEDDLKPLELPGDVIC